MKARIHLEIPYVYHSHEDVLITKNQTFLRNKELDEIKQRHSKLFIIDYKYDEDNI